jgi:hypothetical protein
MPTGTGVVLHLSMSAGMIAMWCVDDRCDTCWCQLRLVIRYMHRRCLRFYRKVCSCNLGGRCEKLTNYSVTTLRSCDDLGWNDHQADTASRFVYTGAFDDVCFATDIPLAQHDVASYYRDCVIGYSIVRVKISNSAAITEQRRRREQK